MAGLFDLPQTPSSGGGLLSPPNKGFLPGLLADPWMRLGLALLEQGGPSPRQHSVGQDISRAVRGMSSQEDEEAQRELQREELERRKRMNELAEKQAQRDAEFLQQMQPYFQQMMGGQGAATPPPVGPAIMPPPPGAPPGPQVQPTAVPPPKGYDQYRQLFEGAAKANPNLPPGILQAIGQVESGFNPMAKGPLVDNAWNAQGMMQFRPETAKARGIDPWNPEQSVSGAGGYLSELMGQHGGDINKALAGYGGGLVDGNISPRGQEYVDKVLGAAQQYGYEPPQAATAAPPQQQFTPGGMAGLPPIPKDIDQRISLTALAQARVANNGAPLDVNFMAAREKMRMDYYMQGAKASTEAAAKAPFDIAKEERTSTLRREEEVAKSGLDVSEDEQKEYGKDLRKLNTIGRKAGTKAASLDRLKALMDEIPNTGKGGETLQDFRGWGVALGVGGDALKSATSAGEAATAIVNDLALKARGDDDAGLPGAVSDRDLQFLVAQFPGLGKTPAGNEKIVGYLKKLAERDQVMATKAREYKRKHGKFEEGFYDEWQKFIDENPLFPEDKAAAAGTQPAAMPRSVKTQADFDALPSGAVYIGDDGKKYRKP